MTQRPAYPIEMLVGAVRKQCAGRLPQELVGPYEGVSVRSIGALSHAKSDEVAFLANPKYIHEVKDCQAGVIVLRQEDKEAIYGEETPRAMVITPNPYAWFAYALQVVEAMQMTFARDSPWLINCCRRNGYSQAVTFHIVRSLFLWLPYAPF